MTIPQLQAINQKIVLKPVTLGDSVQIPIRNENGSVPSSINFSPYGGSYNHANNLITWESEGINTLSWSENNFSGTITQQVKERD